MGTLPSGWDSSTVAKATALAVRFGMDPQDLLGLWNSESGLFWRLDDSSPASIINASHSGYYGLIMGYDQFVTPVIGQSWSNLVRYGSLSDQLDAIAKFWDSVAANNLHGESIPSRAQKLGVSPAAVIYSLNFVPAYFANMQNADQPMVIKDGGPDGGAFYRDNPGFDTNGKGYITVRDIQNRIDKMRNLGMNDARVGPLFSAVASVPGAIYGTAYQTGFGLGQELFQNRGWRYVVGGGAFIGIMYALKKWLE